MKAKNLYCLMALCAGGMALPSAANAQETVYANIMKNGSLLRSRAKSGA